MAMTRRKRDSVAVKPDVLIRLRKQQSLSIYRLAQLVEVSESTIRNMENGIPVSRTTVEKCAAYLGQSTINLVCEPLAPTADVAANCLVDTAELYQTLLGEVKGVRVASIIDCLALTWRKGNELREARCGFPDAGKVIARGIRVHELAETRRPQDEFKWAPVTRKAWAEVERWGIRLLLESGTLCRDVENFSAASRAYDRANEILQALSEPDLIENKCLVAQHEQSQATLNYIKTFSVYSSCNPTDLEKRTALKRITDGYNTALDIYAECHLTLDERVPGIGPRRRRELQALCEREEIQIRQKRGRAIQTADTVHNAGSEVMQIPATHLDAYRIVSSSVHRRNSAETAAEFRSEIKQLRATLDFLLTMYQEPHLAHASALRHLAETKMAWSTVCTQSSMVRKLTEEARDHLKGCVAIRERLLPDVTVEAIESVHRRIHSL